jgi:hypothetical protein
VQVLLCSLAGSYFNLCFKRFPANQTKTLSKAVKLTYSAVKLQAKMQAEEEEVSLF